RRPSHFRASLKLVGTAQALLYSRFDEDLRCLHAPGSGTSRAAAPAGARGSLEPAASRLDGAGSGDRRAVAGADRDLGPPQAPAQSIAAKTRATRVAGAKGAAADRASAVGDRDCQSPTGGSGAAGSGAA